jgi:uncharacterized protein YjbI with pentapeptide repeats
MADVAHFNKISEGVKAWNAWRRDHLAIMPDLTRAPLSRRDLCGADLHGADLQEAELEETKLGYRRLPQLMTGGGLSAPANLAGADLTDAHLGKADLTNVDLSGSILVRADLREAILCGARLEGADLTGAFISKADLRKATLRKARLGEAQLDEAKLQQSILEAADLTGANLSGAKLDGADLSRAILVDARLPGATLDGARVYGISAWNVALEGVQQDGLIVTPASEPTVTVDDLEVAQFIYMMLDNRKIRRTIDTITSKVILILGPFEPERKKVLDALRVELRHRGFSPVLIDFEQPKSKDLVDTVKVLSQMSRFVIIDLTAPRCSPQELQIAYDAAKVPIQSLILEGDKPFATFWNLKAASPDRVLEPFAYRDLSHLLASLGQCIISPSLAAAVALEEGRHKEETAQLAWEAQHGKARGDPEQASAAS